MSTKLSLAAAALALLVVPAARAEIKTGDHAKDLSSLRGKVVLLDFWASWCEPCKKELPLLAKMAPRLRQRGIEIVAVNIDERRENAESFLKSHDLHLTVLYDSQQKLVKEYEPPKMPSSFLIDRGGVVRAVNGGFDDGDESKLEKQLTALADK